ncbi:MAG: aminoglycoside phosphotransferase family protein [Nostoc sp. DedVER02]|uniref:aminoglycoside phosphotransferase family protein n=1 Tax=unclassified Nostoc TaxID=2593658 RepID=UPI002AD27F30|nr:MULTISPECIES: aminoglycoside phosphotransferase family protein [unclassified Nostoc]MDZ7989057.1 aminoglycoside phosphotransferase family protein [Nostoc sp. DedVER02]MDZ8111604.1 aminoglycoside phosphotransferase family protein [Nostoc sp. DedVER01b]
MKTILNYKNIYQYFLNNCICPEEIKTISLEYIKLDNFYRQEKAFPSDIAAQLGTTLARLHRDSLNHHELYEFIAKTYPEKLGYQNPNYSAQLLNKIEPEDFSHFTHESIIFFKNYHRHESFTSAVAELTLNQHHCCLTYNTLKLNNILISRDWEKLIYKTEQSNQGIIKLINWENWSWGDPAFDLGTVISNYLLIWLNSLIVHPVIELQKSLQMATIPLEVLHPSIVALTQAYLSSFPILDYYPNFMARVIQFVGLGLLYEIVEISQWQKNFNDRGLCILQVAKSLLCRPEQSFNAVFGMAESEITNLTNLEPSSIK